jgi:hypothetical protein
MVGVGRPDCPPPPVSTERRMKLTESDIKLNSLRKD